MYIRLVISFALILSTLTLQGQAYFDIVTYNIEWLGRPDIAGLSYTRDEQIARAAEDILSADADIYALQEVVIDDVNGNALTDLLAKLNTLDNTDTWDGSYNAYFSYWWDPDFNNYPAQRQAFIYRTSTVSNTTFKTLLTDKISAGDSRFGSGRLPFMMEADVSIGGVERHVYLVNVHLKCCSGSASRRKYSMETLLPTLKSTDNVVILGDMNVADNGGANGEMATWGYYKDNDNNGTVDFVHAAGAKTDLSWADIDHILLSYPLQDELNASPEALRNQTLTTSVSDHSPIKTSLLMSDTPVNQAPTVSITAPTNLQGLQAGDDVLIRASASDADGAVDKVEFYVNDTKLGEDAAIPYEYNWSTPAAGDYTLTVIATDNEGLQSTSSITITLSAPSTTPFISRIFIAWASESPVLKATATVYLVADNAPLTDAEVKISWGDGIGTETNTTDENGAVSFITAELDDIMYVTLAIDKIVKSGYHWDIDRSDLSKSIHRSVTGIETKEVAKSNVKVYPNPFHNDASLSVHQARPGLLTVEVFDSRGQMIKAVGHGHYEPGDYIFSLGLNRQPKGIYVVMIKNGDTVDVLRLIKGY